MPKTKLTTEPINFMSTYLILFVIYGQSPKFSGLPTHLGSLVAYV